MIRTIAIRLLVCLMAFGMFSCVHEFPEAPSVRQTILTVSHELPWRFFDFDYTGTRSEGRGDAQGDLESRYIFEIYPHGSTEAPLNRFTVYRHDISLEDFTIPIDLPVGQYDVWVWNDLVEADSRTDLFYNAGNFGEITYTSPNRGDTEQKDAFQGMFTVDVPSTFEDDVKLDYYVKLKRPLTSYAFLSVDLEEFVQLERTRRGLPAAAPSPTGSNASGFDFDSYTAVFTYTGYLPTVYSMFRNRPIDSAMGVSFKGNLRVVNGKEVLVGFDYFFINGHESSIIVALEIFDEKGVRVSYVPSITIPVERGRATLVRGNFLTSKATGGVGIKPGFNGMFVIEVK